MTRSETTYLLTDRAREKYAVKLFTIGTVATQIDVLARQGYRTLRIKQELPFDLSDSEAAKTLVTWLEKEHFRPCWRPAHAEPDPLRPAEPTEYPELVIHW